MGEASSSLAFRSISSKECCARLSNHYLGGNIAGIMYAYSDGEAVTTFSRPRTRRHMVLFRTDRINDAIGLVEKYHYSHKCPPKATHVVVGTWHDDTTDEALAACIFARSAARWKDTTMVELVRLVRKESTTIPPLTQLISQTVKVLKQQALADLVISYADNTQFHHGGIYQACSWFYSGMRPPRIDGVVVGGKFVAGRTANHRWGTQSPAKLKSLGVDAKPHYDYGKYLYWRPITKKGSLVAQRLGLLNKPYPKPESP